MKRNTIGSRQPAAGIRSRNGGLVFWLRGHFRLPAAGCRLPMVAACASIIALAPPSHAQRGLVEPESASPVTAKPLAIASRHMIAAAHPLAAEAGREMLRAGGSATDAAIAAQLVLGLVEPQSSGLGGGGFVVHWDNAAKSLATYDGRETAPAAATPERFLHGGQPMKFETAVKSGLSIGTPGLVRLLERLHRTHGRLPWARLFDPAIKLSEEGFPVPRRLSLLLAESKPETFAPAARAYFFDENGRARPEAHVLRNPEYAATLSAIATHGAEIFYSGSIADAIVAAARDAPAAPGDLAHSDLSKYRVEERKAVCIGYRARKVCGMAPPSSGGIAVAQILALIEPLEIGQPGATAFAAKDMHLIAEAEKLAYADRARYLGDPAFVSVPEAGLLDPSYLAERRALIGLSRAMGPPGPGDPPKAQKRTFGIDLTKERAGTTHLSVIDAHGNAVSMTTTIEGAFGSGVWAAGFLLNNELTDFSFRPVDAAGVPVANRVEPGKRPRSSMAPTIVFDANGDVEAVLGSPGGGRIIQYVAKTLAGMIDLGLDPQAAAALPNFGSQGQALDLEITPELLAYYFDLQRLGHAINSDSMNSGLHVIARRNGRLEGGADPRRDGVALGD